MQDLAIEKNCAVFCYSQFSRRTEEQRGRMPQVEDLKESGDIENYSDGIILLWWPWRDTLDSRKKPNEYKFLIRKNKTGPCLDVDSYINLDTLKISEQMA
jgi:replicative DNA helicase